MRVTSLHQEPINSAPKIQHKRNNPKRGNSTKFSPKTRRAIIERDNALCVFCGKPYNNIHHIIFASAGGAGEESNGVCVCNDCHEWAHRLRKGRKWFERYQVTVLIAYYKVRENA